MSYAFNRVGGEIFNLFTCNMPIKTNEKMNIYLKEFDGNMTIKITH